MIYRKIFRTRSHLSCNSLGGPCCIERTMESIIGIVISLGIVGLILMGFFRGLFALIKLGGGPPIANKGTNKG